MAVAQDNVRQVRVPDQHGRYVIVFSPIVRADTFLLDSQTGKVWELVTITDVNGQPRIWNAMDRVDSSGQFVEWLRRQSPKADTESAPSH